MIATLKTWTPRVVVGFVAGWYSLGFAYELGVMHKIDLLAMAIFKHFFGRAGIGAFLPVFQPYSAYGVRCIAALMGTVLYDRTEKLVCYVYRKIRHHENPPKVV